jgi:WS/DGAT/MGAT family acyltransferase
VVSPHRVFETRRFDLADFKAIRNQVDGATVNDAVLAVCGGALRRYLESHAELPETSLTAMTPMYVHAAGGKSKAPEAPEPPVLTWTCVELGTDIADPLQRLQKVQSQTGSSAVIARAVGARELQQIGSHVPAATLALTGKLLGSATAGVGRRAPLANCTVTNVPGPSQPLYLCGARMTYFSAIMPIADGMGLVFAVTSYDGRVTISPTSCRELMPDPAHFAQCVRDSFQEYLALAQAQPARRRPATQPKRPATPPAPPSTARRAAPKAARRRASSSGTDSPTTRTA